MSKILIFGGTSEGRQLCEFCIKNNIEAYVSTATVYGAELLPKSNIVTVVSGRKNSLEIAGFIQENNVSLVIDATHPYAFEVSENILTACGKTHCEYIRVKRGESVLHGNCFDDIDSAVIYLDGVSGNILFTIGSKELAKFSGISNFSNRSAARVLPSEESVKKCREVSIESGNIIAQQGPFTKSENIAHIQKYNAAYLVTKESGSAGGFEEKAEAAEECGIELVVIRRREENGITVAEAEKLLLERKNG